VHIRRPPAIAAAAALAALTLASGYFIADPGSHPRLSPAPQSAIEPPGAQAFAARAVRPGATAAAQLSVANTAEAATDRAWPASFFLDHRAIDPGGRDRNGNAPRRDLSHDELVRLASEYDVIEDDLRGQPDGVALSLSQMQEMRRINPRLKIVRYLWTLTSNDVALSTVEPGDGVHEDWFLRDATGNFVRAYDGTPGWNGHVSYALDPASVNVRLALGAQARVARKVGYDGVLLDDAIPYVAAPGTPHDRSVLASRPVNRATAAPYTDAEWRAAVEGLVARVREIAGADSYIAISGMTGSDYFAAGGRTLAALADAVLLQPFATSGAGPVAASRWLDDVNAATEIATSGKVAIAYAPGAAAPARQERIDRFAFASYLATLGATPALYGQAAPQGLPPEAYAMQPSYRLAPLGRPIGQLHEADGLLVRLFEHGAVLVNTDDVEHAVQLPGRYHTPDGVPVFGRMALPAHDAAILVTDE
jgi:hypothetical protein